MIIPGYPSGSLVDASSLMADELFWPAFLGVVGGSRTAPHAFGAGPADLESFLSLYGNPNAWPVLSLSLAGGATLHIVERNLPGDQGTDYVLQAGDRSFRLAALDGGFRGPALSWPELTMAATQPEESRSSTARPDPPRFSTARPAPFPFPTGPVHSAAARLLLMLPACADAARPADASTTVAAALTAVGAVARIDQVTAELLDDRRHWPPDTAWTTVGDALVCEDPHSPRSRAAGLTPSDLALITAAFRNTA